MEKSIDKIFDDLAKTTVVIFLLNLFGLNDEKDNNDTDSGDAI
jgi:hypothetical protein